MENSNKCSAFTSGQFLLNPGVPELKAIWDSRFENAREAGKLMDSTGMGMRNATEPTRPNNSERAKHKAKTHRETKTQR